MGTKKKGSKVTTATKSKKKPPTPAQRGQQITWRLDGCLKRERIVYLLVGELLAQVRDGKLYGELGHPTMEDYAWQRLNLGRATLYAYLDVYDWAKVSHPEWLVPHPKGFIPDFSDMRVMKWIEEELKRTDLTRQERSNLVSMQEKALSGKLTKTEAAAARRRRNRGATSLKALQSKVRRLRKEAAGIVGTPEEVLKEFDAIIALLERAKPVQAAQLAVLKQHGSKSFSPEIIAAIA